MRIQRENPSRANIDCLMYLKLSVNVPTDTALQKKMMKTYNINSKKVKRKTDDHETLVYVQQYIPPLRSHRPWEHQSK